MKLRVQVALVSMFVTALILGWSGVLAIRLVLNRVDGTADQALRARSRSIERRLIFSSTRPVLPFEIPSNFRSFGPSRVVPLAQLLTDSGKVLSTFGRASTKALLSGSLHIPALGATEFYSLSRFNGVYRVVVERSAFNDFDLVLVALPIGPDLALVNRLRDVLIIIRMLSVMRSGFGSHSLARRVLAPVERLRRRAAEAEISTEVITLPLPQTRDEVEALGRTLNTLLGRLQGGLADQHRFLSDASHELRTPRAAPRLELELAVSTERSEEELRRSSQEALSTTETLVESVERLFALSVLNERIPISDSNELDIVEICQDAVALRAE
ncbi:MAG: HAMP domain-containing protein [Acidimicrobiales bacterium]